MKYKINKVISVCTIKDIKTWFFASKQIKKYIKSDIYEVIVPSRYIELFKALTEEGWTIVDENLLSTEFSLNYIIKNIPEGRRGDAGWYYQQLLKLQALINSGVANERLLIWDADTIPLRTIEFFHEEKAIYFTGSEHHQPYFESIKKLLNLDKIVNFSFIAQCFPAYASWVIYFKTTLEKTHNKPWYDAVLACTDFNKDNAFSEYETLGTFFTHNFSDKMLLNTARWERNGAGLFPLEDVTTPPLQEFPVFLSYERKWGVQLNKIKLSSNKFYSENEFITAFFKDFQLSRHITVAGLLDDKTTAEILNSTREKINQEISILIIDPSSYFLAKILNLLGQNINATTIQASPSSREGLKEFYYLDQVAAVEILGPESANYCEYFHEFIEIKDIFQIINKKNTTSKVNEYINSPNLDNLIRKHSVNCIPLKNIQRHASQLSLLIIGLLGDIDILLGLDWSKQPDFIFCSKKLHEIREVNELLNSFDYSFLFDSDSIILYNKNTISLKNENIY
jgi:hypothetical protein